MTSKSFFSLPAALVLLVSAILACNFAPSVNSAPTAPLLQAPTNTAEPSPQPAAQGVPISFANVGFVNPDGLSSGALSESLPAVSEGSGGPWGVAPAYTRFTLQNYVLQGTFHQPQIFIYPAQEYAAVGAGAAESLKRLQNVLSNPGGLYSNDVLPYVPFFNAAQIFASQQKIVQFRNGSGLRVVTEYAQGITPIDNGGLFYHFEGLTGDGKSYVIAILPVNIAFLPATSDPAAPLPPNGVPFPDLNQLNADSYNSYLQSVVGQLNSASAESFSPPLALLDSLMQSLQVSP